MLLEQPHQLVIDVADHVRKDVDATSEQVLGVFQIGGVNGDAHVPPMRLVDDGAIEVGRELPDGAASIVHPGLDDPHVPPGEFFDGGACALLGRHRIRRVAHVVGTDLGERREAATGRQKPCGIGVHFIPHLKWQLAKVGPHRLARRHTEVGEAMQVVENVLARVVLGPAAEVFHVADVRVRIDQRGNHGLAGQVDPRRARRRRHVALPADARESVVFDDKRGSLRAVPPYRRRSVGARKDGDRCARRLRRSCQ